MSKKHHSTHRERDDADKKPRADDPVYTVKQIAPEKLLCAPIVEVNGQLPPKPTVDQRIKLTAVVADKDGKPAPAGVNVNWGYADSLGSGLAYWYPDLKYAAVRDVAFKATDDNGNSTIYLAGALSWAGNVIAYTDGQQKGDQQCTVACWLFAGDKDLVPDTGSTDPNDPDLMVAPSFTVEQGSTIRIPPYDLGDAESYDPIELFARSQQILASFDPRMSGVYFVRGWNHKDQKDFIISPPQVFSEQRLEIYIPYRIMNTDDVENANSVTYCFYNNTNPYSSKVFNYKAIGNAIWAPDVKNFPTNSYLKKMLYVEADVPDGWDDPLTTDQKLWPKIASTPPQIITKQNFGQDKLLNFALPAPDDLNVNDTFVVTTYLNGVDKDGNPHATTTPPPDSTNLLVVYGDQFSTHFTGIPDGGASKYALVQIRKSDVLDYEQDENGTPGIMYIEYVRNGIYHSLWASFPLDVRP